MKGIKLTCPVKAVNGKLSLIFPEHYQEAKESLLEYCIEKRGGFISVSLSPPKRPRSTGQGSQSHHLNGHIQQIAVLTGQPFEDIKKYIKAEAVSRGYPMLTNDEGKPMYDLWGNIQGISESDCTVEDCILLIDQVHQFADENDIKLKEE